ncbi:MAG: hypothetical protein H6811_10555 [Phycisphaeraceae bacterium]|nr:hypothetical protein [Phycisphaeraceae bacterium]
MSDTAPIPFPLAQRASTPRPTPRQAVTSENVAAAGLQPSDARWVLAARVAQSLDGQRAGLLPPERRRRLVAQGVSMGLREFDANLVIAVVQDGARTGEGALSRNVEQRLTLIRNPRSDARTQPVWLSMLAAAVGALALLTALIIWVLH